MRWFWLESISLPVTMTLKQRMRVGGRVVDCSGLENRRRLTPSKGSNPFSPATRA